MGSFLVASLSQNQNLHPLPTISHCLSTIYSNCHSFFSFIYTELEGELVDDEFQPFSTPSGYSINMAPGSGLTAAYSQASAGPPPPATQVCYCSRLNFPMFPKTIFLLLFFNPHSAKFVVNRLPVRCRRRNKKNVINSTNTKQKEQVSAIVCNVEWFLDFAQTSIRPAKS